MNRRSFLIGCLRAAAAAAATSWCPRALVTLGAEVTEFVLHGRPHDFSVFDEADKMLRFVPQSDNLLDWPLVTGPCREMVGSGWDEYFRALETLPRDKRNSLLEGRWEDGSG